VLWIVANRHLPYEAELKDAFKRVDMIADSGGYKVFEAVK
jgi:16S rRNA (guanine1207-N2)-methyltransferase